jgi:hypothetical protein
LSCQSLAALTTSACTLVLAASRPDSAAAASLPAAASAVSPDRSLLKFRVAPSSRCFAHSTGTEPSLCTSLSLSLSLPLPLSRARRHVCGPYVHQLLQSSHLIRAGRRR